MMIILNAIPRLASPGTIRVEPLETPDWAHNDPEYDYGMESTLPSSYKKGRYTIKWKSRVYADSPEHRNLLAWSQLPGEETVTYWLNHKIADPYLMRRTQAPGTPFSMAPFGFVSSYYPAIFGVVSLEQTVPEGCIREWAFTLEETYRLSGQVKTVVFQDWVEIAWADPLVDDFWLIFTNGGGTYRQLRFRRTNVATTLFNKILATLGQNNIVRGVAMDLNGTVLYDTGFSGATFFGTGSDQNGQNVITLEGDPLGL